MRSPRLAAILLFALLLVQHPSAQSETVGAGMQWGTLPPIPDSIGVAGPFAGPAGDVFVVGGGANFPDGAPWAGGAKAWSDRVYVLDDPAGEWREMDEPLPRPLAYGVALPGPEGLYCIGGADAGRHYANAFILKQDGTRLVREELPDLPEPCAYACGAVLGETLYVAGGRTSPTSASTMHTFWALPLTGESASRQWQALPPWPGRPRMLAVASARDGAFYLFSGVDLVPGQDGAPVREYLTDAWRYRPGAGWEELAPLPRPAAAAPSPAPAVGPAHLFIIGGDDGSLAARVDELRDTHPGFTPEVLAYHTITDTWTVAGRLPSTLRSPVTTSVAEWRGMTLIASGEVRPAVRSSQVLSLRFAPDSTSRFGWLDYLVMGVYLLVMIAIGVVCMGRQTSTTDYFLAGRRIPAWAAGLSIFGTQLSAITFMAIPAKAFATNWVYLINNLMIVLLAPVVVYVFLPFFSRLNLTTAYEYLELRFNRAVRMFASAAFILFQVGRMAVVLYLPALALSAVTGLRVETSILLMGVATTIYVSLGGVEAVIWTDVTQVVVLLGGAFLALSLIVWDAGGAGSVISAAGEAGKFHMFDWTSDATTTAVWVVVVGGLFTNLIPYTSDQSVVQRYLATPDERAAARSVWINAALTLPASLLFFGIGSALFVFYQRRPELLNPSLPGDAIFPWFIVQNMPSGLAGLVIMGVFAAAMSTLSSSVNSVVVAIVTDFVRPMRGSLSEPSALRLSRGLTVFFGLLGTASALFLASRDVRSLWDVFLMVLGLFGSAQAGLFTLGIFSRRATGAGALAGAAAAVAVVYSLATFTPVHFFLYAPAGILSCVGVGMLASTVLGTRRDAKPGLTLWNMGRNRD